MLSGIDRERLADELHELRLTLAAAGEQDGEFTRDCIALGLKRIAGLLPEDCELLADRSAVDRVRRITRFSEELADTIESETSVDVPLPDLARRCYRLERELRGRPAADQNREAVAGADPSGDGQRQEGHVDVEHILNGVLLAAAGDDEPIRAVMAIANDGRLTAGQKMVKILLDSTNRRFEAFSSEEWGQLLGVSGQSIRKTGAWTALKEAKRTGETFAQVWMHRE